jgi:hypothetical protein
MEEIFRTTTLYPDIQSVVFDYLTTLSEDKYWQSVYKNFFSMKVLSKLAPKAYFSQHVLPEINQGWTLVGINTYVFCNFCLPNRETHPDCCNCNTSIPCANCYFYGSCGNCANQWELISWKKMYGFLSDLRKYKNYTEFRKKNSFIF